MARMAENGGILFSFKVINAVKKEKLKESIVNATESSPELREEIRRIFKEANSRIKRVEATGQYSPALAALNRVNVSGYRFSMREFQDKSSWTRLKEEYGKAIAFLNQPTSTVQGTTEFNEYLRDKYSLSPVEYESLANNFMGKLDSLSESQYIDQYLKKYRDFSGDFEQAMKSSANQMELEAVLAEQQLQAEINAEAAEQSGALYDALENLFQGFNM